ncbi:MAG: exodeoxyribonuclease V subunit gamma [Nitrospirae bacterium]|nr:exodeoxyribonuclease V subunit gamma [Nitrospirota bacterium]
MQKIYLGNFHPDLEQAIFRNIRFIKEEDPLAPIAIVVPSKHLSSRLKVFLTRECGMNLMGVHFLTFHSLAVKVCEERYGHVKNLITDDFFFTEFLRRILKEDSAMSGADAFRYFSDTPEGCGALWATLRDMKDARVDPDILAEALREGVFKNEDISKVVPLNLLFKEFFSRLSILGITGYSDFTDMAEGLVPSSEFLHKFKEIIYYGFYDLTQVQYDLFHSIAQNYPCSLYFPLVDNTPAYSFAKRFYEGYIQGMINDQGNIIRLSTPVETAVKSETLFPFGHKTIVINVSGAEDEVLTVAKGILRLVEDDEYNFSDIGVTARDIDGYGLLIERIFRTHRIPYISSAKVPVNRYQNTKAVHLLLSVLREDFRRSDIIDLVSSHYCRVKEFCPQGVEPEPDLWDMVSRKAGISKGIEEWKRLDKYGSSSSENQPHPHPTPPLEGEGINIAPSPSGRGPGEGGVFIALCEPKAHVGSSENNPPMPPLIQRGGVSDEDAYVPPIKWEQISGLKSFITSLKTDFDTLPGYGEWEVYIDKFRQLIKKYLDTESFIDDALLSLKSFNLTSREVTLNDFTDIFIRRLEKMSIPVGDDNIAGVQVLDVMSARGIPFKVLFILNMNEKVFPRNIREDPLLKDAVRRIIEHDLGFKINFKITEKLYGYEEEKLLFYLLLSSASERVFILYQRTDEAGQIKIPSGYIYEMTKGYPLKPEINIPRRLSDKFTVSEYFTYRLLTPKELAVRVILERRDTWDVISGFDLNPVLYKNGLAYLKMIENKGHDLTRFDGLTGELNLYRENIKSYGISPTSLEAYARCPFSYFMSRVLGLRKLERPENICEISPADTGTICHAILRRFYSSGNCSFEEAALAEFKKYQEENQTGYPLLWEILQKRLTNVLKALIELDNQEMSVSGFKPFAYEIDERSLFHEEKPHPHPDPPSCLPPQKRGEGFGRNLIAALPEGEEIPLPFKEKAKDDENSLPFKGRVRACPRSSYRGVGMGLSPDEAVSFHGIIDRIDVNTQKGQFRVIDYKFKTGRKMSSDDKNLPLSAVRGKRLQPPLYLLMAKEYLKKMGLENLVSSKVSFYFIAPAWDSEDKNGIRSEFPGDCWDGPLGSQINTTAALLIKGIMDGLFFIIPGDYCDNCDYSTICRKNHFPSFIRAERDERVRPYYNLRKEVVK